MSAQIIPVDPFDYIVFGGTGDLAERKLLPALYHRQVDGQIVDPTCIYRRIARRDERRRLPQIRA
jgi:glucose-6-phosphate 1-dehydrogenase